MFQGLSFKTAERPVNNRWISIDWGAAPNLPIETPGAFDKMPSADLASNHFFLMGSRGC